MATYNPTNEFELLYAKLLPIAVLQGSIPQYLYKYRTMESFLKCIDTSSLYFPTFKQLNDPFEAFAKYDTNNSDTDWINLFHKMGVPAMVHPMLLDTVKKNKDKASEIIKDCISKSNDNTGVLSLSTSDDNLLLWTHYSDEGKGVCMGFDILEDPCFFLLPKQVIYDNNVIKMNYLQEQDRSMEPLYHKSGLWSYENEYRVIKPNFVGARTFAKKALSSITFGANVDSPKIEELKSKVTALGYGNVTYKKAQVGEDPTKLRVIDI